MLIMVLGANITSRIAGVLMFFFPYGNYLNVFFTLVSLTDSSFSPYFYLLMSDQFKNALQRIVPCGRRTCPLHNVEMVDREQRGQTVAVIGINAVEPLR